MSVWEIVVIGAAFSLFVFSGLIMAWSERPRRHVLTCLFDKRSQLPMVCSNPRADCVRCQHFLEHKLAGNCLSGCLQDGNVHRCVPANVVVILKERSLS